MIKKIIKRTPVYSVLYQLKMQHNNRRAFQVWKQNGKPVPPPHIIKQLTIKEYARDFNLDILIETGTAYGEMIYAMKDVFKQIYSIELSEKLASDAQERFSKQTNVQVLHGDSPRVLETLLPTIVGPTLFWLDAHYSSGNTARGDLDSPIMQELSLLLKLPQKRNVILIDDARKFDGHDGYSTIAELRAFMKQHRPDWAFEIKDDIIRAHPHKRSN